MPQRERVYPKLTGNEGPDLMLKTTYQLQSLMKIQISQTATTRFLTKSA
jgi:hypothetical protein